MDSVTLLSAVRRSAQTKRFQLDAEGKLTALRPQMSTFWTHDVLPIASGESLHAVLDRLESSSREIIVRATPKRGASDSIRRLTNDQKDGTRAPLKDVDHRWLCIDVDKADAPSSLDWHDRATWDDAVKDLVKRILPSCFDGVACSYQWSSSAATRDDVAVSVHLWYWSSRAVCSKSLHAWAMEPEQKGFDAALFVTGQPHYIARPIFSPPELDPLPCSRLGRLEGVAEVDLPARILDLEGEAARRAEVTRAKVAVKEAAKAARESKRASKARPSAPRQRGESDRLTLSGNDDERMLRDAIYSIDPDDYDLWVAVGQALHQWETLCDDRFGRGFDVWEDWGRTSPKWDADESTKKWETFHERSTGDGRGAGSLIHLARESGWMSPGEMARARASEINEARQMQQTSGETKMSTTTFEADPPSSSLAPLPPASPRAWESALSGLLSQTIASPPIVIAPLPTRAEARKIIRDMIESAIERGGVTMVKAQPGLGKSRETMAVIIAMARADETLRFDIVLPTHALCLEMLREYLQVAPELNCVHATTRTKETCIIFDEVRAFGDLRPEMGSRRCRECDIHPENMDGADTCPVMLSRTDRGAQIQFKTAALWQVTASELDEDSRPDVVIVDESVWNVCLTSAKLTVADIADLIASRELVGGATPSGLPATDALLQLCRRSDEEGKRLDSSVIREVMGAGLSFEEDDERAEEIYQEARATAGEATIARLQAAVGWRARAALRDTLEDDWRGAYAQRGELHVASWASFAEGASVATIALDATAHPVVTRALFGEDAGFEVVEIEIPKHATVIKLDANFGPRAHIGPGEDESKLTQARYACALDWLRADKHTLIVTMKRWLEEGSTSRAIIAAVSRGAEVIHHGGVAARGSNAYRGCHTVFVPHFKAPVGASTQAGELLSRALGEDYHGREVVWQKIACGQIEGAPLAQVAARIRYLDATEEEPRRIVYAAPEECDASILGAGDDDPYLRVFVDDLLWSRGSIPTRRSVHHVIGAATTVMPIFAPTIHTFERSPDPLRWDDVLTTPTPELLLAFEAISQAHAQPQFASPAPNDRSAERTYADQSSGAVATLIDIAGVGGCPSAWVVNQVRNTYEGDWTICGWATSPDPEGCCNIEHAKLEVTGCGGRPIPVYFDVALATTPVALVTSAERLASRAGAQSWRLGPVGPFTNTHAVEAPLVTALSEIELYSPSISLKSFYALLLAVLAENGEEDWNARRLETALMRNCPAYKSKAQHLLDEGVKAKHQLWNSIVEAVQALPMEDTPSDDEKATRRRDILNDFRKQWAASVPKVTT